MAVLATLVALGYGMAMAALALLLGGQAGVGWPLLVVGLAHMAGGGVGLVLLPLSPHGSRLMDSSKEAMSSSLAVLEEVTTASVSPIVEKPRGQ
jgi:hypothetical protein